LAFVVKRLKHRNGPSDWGRPFRLEFAVKVAVRPAGQGRRGIRQRQPARRPDRQPGQHGRGL